MSGFGTGRPDLEITGPGNDWGRAVKRYPRRTVTGIAAGPRLATTSNRPDGRPSGCCPMVVAGRGADRRGGWQSTSGVADTRPGLGGFAIPGLGDAGGTVSRGVWGGARRDRLWMKRTRSQCRERAGPTPGPRDPRTPRASGRAAALAWTPASLLGGQILSSQGFGSVLPRSRI